MSPFSKGKANWLGQKRPNAIRSRAMRISWYGLGLPAKIAAATAPNIGCAAAATAVGESGVEPRRMPRRDGLTFMRDH